MTNPAYRQAALNLMLNEQAPTLNMPVGTDLDGYAQQLIARFTNPSLKHQTWQIAMDGSQKLPQRMVDSVLFHLKNGSDYRHLALGIAGWMRYVSGEGENGEVIDVRDPLLSRFQAIYAEHGLSCNVVKPLLAIEAIFGPELPQQGLLSMQSLRHIKGCLTMVPVTASQRSNHHIWHRPDQGRNE